jgi:hypothetical protein
MRPRWVDGATYERQQVEPWVWPGAEHPADMKFVYRAGAHEYAGYFDEVVEASPFSLVSAEEVQEEDPVKRPDPEVAESRPSSRAVSRAPG